MGIFDTGLEDIPYCHLCMLQEENLNSKQKALVEIERQRRVHHKTPTSRWPYSHSLQLIGKV